MENWSYDLSELKNYYDRIYSEITESSQFNSKDVWVRTKVFERLKAILNCIKELSSNRSFLILDLGCADGWFLEKLDENGFAPRYVGIDFSIQNLRKASIKKNGSWVLGDVTNLPFRTNSFDLVICSEVIEHLLDPEKCITESERIVRFYAIFTTPLSGSPIVLDQYRYNRIVQELNRIRSEYIKKNGIKNALDRFGPHIYAFTLSNLRQLFDDYFTEVESKGICFLFPLLPGLMNRIPQLANVHMKLQNIVFQRIPIFRIIYSFGNQFGLVLLRTKMSNCTE